MTLIKFGYITRRTVSGKVDSFRDWWLGKDRVQLGQVRLPKELIGKRIRFKVEVMKDDIQRL